MAMRSAGLQGGYFIIAARALGLDCGPMSGFDNDGVDKEFFAGTAIKSYFLCNLGYGDAERRAPARRAARLRRSLQDSLVTNARRRYRARRLFRRAAARTKKSSPITSKPMERGHAEALAPMVEEAMQAGMRISLRSIAWPSPPVPAPSPASASGLPSCAACAWR